MSYILPLLAEMRGRLAMYVGATSLTKLAAFLRGYDYAAEKLGGRAADPFLAEFRDWIHERFGTSERSWEDTILRHSTDEGAAVKRFWELLDEYLQERPMNLVQQGTPTNGATGSVSGSRVSP